MEQATTIRASRDVELNELVHRWQNGETDADAELYRHCRPELVRRMRRYASADIDADDLAQDVWLKISRAIHSFDATRPFWPWAGRIASNHGTDALRKRGVRILEADGLQLLETLPADRDSDATAELFRRSVLRTALNDVPDRQREAIVSVLVLGEEHAVVASRLGLTTNALRQLLHRGRATMRASVERAGMTARDFCLAPLVALRRVGAYRSAHPRNSHAAMPSAAALLAAATLVGGAASSQPEPHSAERNSAVLPTAADVRSLSGAVPSPSGAAPAVAAVLSRVRHQLPMAEPVSAAPKLTPALVNGGDITLPTGTSITAAPTREPDHAYGVETDITGRPTHVAGVESYDQHPQVRPVEAAVCDAFRQGTPGTYCRGREVPAQHPDPA